MPKIKTNRAAAKRFKATGSGKFKAKKAYRSHLLGHKSPGRKRRLRQGNIIDATNVRGVRRLLPNL